MQKKTYVSDFTTGRVTPQLYRFALPLFLSSLLQIVYNMVDMVIVGQVLGAEGLSAVSVGGDVSNFLTFIAMGFCSAGQVIISQYLGAKKTEQIGRFISTMFTSLMVCAITLSVICLGLREPILHLMNTPAESFAEALNYSAVCMAGMVFIYGYNIGSAVLRGLGDSKHPFIFISIAALMNVALDILFVIVLDMRAAGAALATVLSQGVSFLCCAVFIMRNKQKFNLTLDIRCFLHPDREMLSSLVKLGIPMAIKSASIQFSKLFVNSWINSYGVAVSAFAGIANKVNSISNLVSNSMNTAGSSMVGQNIGAERYNRVPKIMRSIFMTTATMATVMSLTVVLFPQQVFLLFTPDESVLALVGDYLPIAVLIFFGSACRSPMNALINGSGNHRINFATAILDGIVLRIGLALLFGLALDMKHVGFWLGDALAGFTPMWIGFAFYFTGKWKRRSIK